jgi:hypothetical protein
MKVTRIFPFFSTAFAVIYLAAMYNNLALVSYFPRTRQWFFLTVTDLPRSAGPGMYWYGWLATSFLGAAALAALALALPAPWLARLSRPASWAVPIVVILAIIYILRGWFLR